MNAEAVISVFYTIDSKFYPNIRIVSFAYNFNNLILKFDKNYQVNIILSTLKI